MRKLLLLPLFLLATGMASANPQSIFIDRSHSVAFDVPPGWTLTQRPTSPDLPMRGALLSNGKAGIMLTLTLVSPYSDLARTSDKARMLGEMLGHLCENDLPQSVEGKATVKDLNGAGMTGKIVQLTNKGYTPATAKDGDFHYLSTAMLLLNDDTLVRVRFVSNSLDDADYQAGLAILRDFHSARKP